MMWYTMNEGYRAWVELKSVLSNSGLGIMVKKCLYEGVILKKVNYYYFRSLPHKTLEKRFNGEFHINRKGLSTSIST